MARKFGATAKYTFTLTVDTADLDARIGCAPPVKTFGSCKNSTKLDDLIPPTTTSVGSASFSFLDPNKKTRKWVFTMRNLIDSVVLPTECRGEYRCWWCHQPIVGSLLGCPIRIGEIKDSPESYQSFLAKKEVTPLCSLPEKKSDCFYHTIGMFDDWGCLMGYIESKNSECLYRESRTLALKMYAEAGFSGIPHPSPPFSMLTEYGGPLTPEEYRNKYHLDTYRPTGNLFIRMVPVGELFDLSSKF